MKYAIIIPDGAADLPVEELGGKTPLEAANTPNLDWITSHGKVGRVQTVPKTMHPGSDVAILSVIGYDPKQYYSGRAPLEAAAQGLKVAPDEWIFRCNLVTVVDGIMEDYSAGHITTEEAGAIINELNYKLGGDRVKFYRGISYRHLMTYKGECNVSTVAPHDIMGKPVKDHLPTGQGAEDLRRLMERSCVELKDHDINTVRRDLGENPATSIWLWGQGKSPELPSFLSRFGLKGAAITAVDLVRGLAKLIGWEIIEVPGATGYIDTNYAGKGLAAVAALDRMDLVCVHVEATDEAGHNGDAASKVQSMEQIDRHIIGPVLQRLQAEGDQWRILVLPDHPTPVSLRTHTREPVPFAIAGRQVEGVVSNRMTESAAAESDLQIARGCDLMEFFLTVR